LKEETARLNSEYSEMKTEFLTARERLGAARSEFDQNRQALEEIVSRRSALDAEQAGIRQRLDQIAQETATFDVRFSEALDQQEELRVKLAGQEETIAQCRIRIQAGETELEQRRQAMDVQREHKSRLEVEQARLENEITHLEEGAVMEFHQSLRPMVDDSEVDTEELGVEEASKRYLEYREKTERMGSVNLIAVEEYDREEERLLFHQAQEQDIAESIVSTQKGIEEIDRRSARLFKDTFEQINLHFREMFQVLFGGGFCELRLVDEENLLESGVDIVASPPGKKLQNLLLLSGGEKALTALALLLAIFKYRPSPFCILDEVDAPLDESNIERFVNLTKQMSDQTQFVLITHNKRTMEIADSIYGITMEEAGISKVLSVQLKDVESVLTT
jgi:chromosome segregation protein